MTCPCGDEHPHVHMVSNDDQTDSVWHLKDWPSSEADVGNQLRQSRGEQGGP